jgi:hypothetical protein
MPKFLPDDRLLREHPMQSGVQPQPLSDDLIAQLQMAVNKARQKRTLQPSAAGYPEKPLPKS